MPPFSFVTNVTNVITQNIRFKIQFVVDVVDVYTMIFETIDYKKTRINKGFKDICSRCSR